MPLQYANALRRVCLNGVPVFAIDTVDIIENSSVLPDELMHEINDVGNRRSHYQSFMSLIRNFPKWGQEKENYNEIQVPVLLVYGDHDWSTENERLDTKSRINNARLETITDGGHFLSLEKPNELAKLIFEYE